VPLDWARQATAIDDVTWQVSWADCRESKKNARWYLAFMDSRRIQSLSELRGRRLRSLVTFQVRSWTQEVNHFRFLL